MAASLTRVTEAIFPEILAVAAVGVLSAVGRGLDAAWGLNRPFRRVSDWLNIAVLGGSAWMIATNKAPDMAKAALYAESGLLFASLGQVLYNSAMGVTRGPRARAKLAGGQTVVTGPQGARLLPSGQPAPAFAGSRVASVLEI